MARKSPKDWAITRLHKNGKTVGFWVRLHKQREIVAQRSFRCNRYGGVRKTKAAARDWRESRRKVFGIAPPSIGRRRPREADQRNWVGEVGIKLALHRLPDGSYALYWASGWQTRAGRTRVCHRSIAWHGYQSAWDQVAKARYRGLGRNVSEIPLPPPKRRITNHLKIRFGCHWRSVLNHPWPIGD